MGGPHHPLRGRVVVTAAAYARRLSLRVLRDGQHQRKENFDGTRYVRDDDNGGRDGRGGLQAGGGERAALLAQTSEPTWLDGVAVLRERRDAASVQLRHSGTVPDLDRLDADLRAGKLPETAGFFFGESYGSEAEGDLAFIAKARDALAAGLTVVYASYGDSLLNCLLTPHCRHLGLLTEWP